MRWWQDALKESADRVASRLRAHGLSPQMISLFRTAMDKLAEVKTTALAADKQAVVWQQATTLLGTLERNLSRDGILQFAIVVVGKVDAAYLIYEPVAEALGNLERQLNSDQPWSVVDSGSGVGKGTGASAECAEGVEALVTMARAMVEYSGKYVIQYGPDR